MSLHDPDARPIRKGRLGRPVEFGYKGQVVDNADGVILDWSLHAGNPSDAAQLVPAIKRIRRRTGKVPRAGHRRPRLRRGRGGRRAGGPRLTKVCIPRKGRPGAARRAVESSGPFRRMVRWRTGAEGRISCMKRDFGCRRTRMDTLAGARTWTGHSVLAHNLSKIAALMP